MTMKRLAKYLAPFALTLGMSAAQQQQAAYVCEPGTVPNVAEARTPGAISSLEGIVADVLPQLSEPLAGTEKFIVNFEGAGPVTQSRIGDDVTMARVAIGDNLQNGDGASTSFYGFNNEGQAVRTIEFTDEQSVRALYDIVEQMCVNYEIGIGVRDGDGNVVNPDARRNYGFEDISMDQDREGPEYGQPFWTDDSVGVVQTPSLEGMLDENSPASPFYVDAGQTNFNALFASKFDLSPLVQAGYDIIAVSSNDPFIKTETNDDGTVSVYGTVRNGQVASQSPEDIRAADNPITSRGQPTVGYEFGSIDVMTQDGAFLQVPLTVDVNRDSGIGIYDGSDWAQGERADSSYRVEDVGAALTDLAEVVSESGLKLYTEAQGGARGPYSTSEWVQRFASPNLDYASLSLVPQGHAPEVAGEDISAILTFESNGQRYQAALGTDADQNEPLIHSLVYNAVQSMVGSSNNAPISLDPSVVEQYLNSR